MRYSVILSIAALWVLAGCSGADPEGFVVLQHEDLQFGDANEIPQFEWTKTHADDVDALVQTIREILAVPSFAVGIVHGNKLVYARAFGYRALSIEQPAESDTLYNIGSVSKPIAATLLAVLVEQGQLDLDDRVVDYLPNSVRMPTYDGRPVELTLRHLATHTSGLPMDPPNRRNVNHGLWLNPGQAKPYSVASLYEALGKTKLLFEPGTQCRYSNYGYGLLGHVLESAAGMPLEELLKTQLLLPLSMTSTTVTLDEAQRDRFAAHYWADDHARPRRERPRAEFGAVFAHGGLISSAEDLARLVSFQFRGQADVLSLAALERLRNPQQATDGSPLLLDRDGVSMQMCIGWRVQWPDQSSGIVNHSGEMDGHSAYMAFAPQTKMGVIVLANLGGARHRRGNPTAAVRLGVLLKQEVLYPALGWRD